MVFAEELIHFALLIPFSGSWDVGHRIAGAAALAVERINADKALLAGRRLEYSWADSGCRAQQGLAVMGEQLRKAIRVGAVIGPGCSSACEVTSYLSGGSGIPQVSWGCASPKLSNKDEYPLVRPFPSSLSLCALTACGCDVLVGVQFSRTTAPHASRGPALIAFTRHNKWRRLVFFTSTDEVYFDSGLSLAKQLEASGNEVLKPAAFEPGSLKDAMLTEIRRSGFRIVFVLAFDADTQTVASLAHREEMVTGFAWVTPGSEVLLVPALLGWIWVRPFLASGAMQAFALHVSHYSKSHFNITVSPESVDLTHSAALYDAIMLYTHAAMKVLSEGGDLQDGVAVTAAMRSTMFAGAGDQIVSLDIAGDQIEYEIIV